MTDNKSTQQGKSTKQVNIRIDSADHELLRTAFKHLDPDRKLSDYKFYSKLFEIFCHRIRGEGINTTRGSFAPLIDILREEAQAIVAGQGSTGNSDFSSDSSLTNSLDFDILSQCPHYQGHNDQVCFCKSRSKQLSRFKGKIPHSVCNVHWLRHQKAWESLSPEEKQHKQRQMEEQRFKRRDYTSSQPYYDG